MEDIDRAKQALRERVWTLLDDHAVVQPPGAAGHIPAFVGAEEAARRLAKVPAWQSATVVKANPDRAQLPIRVQALREGKLVYMAVPNLATEEPFYLLDPSRLRVPFEEAGLHRTAAQVARRVRVEDMQPVEFIVCGSVAVNRRGARIGKGAGYSDIEVALLTEAGLISDQTTIATTVHTLQVVDEDIPETDHDFSVDIIATLEDVILCEKHQRPRGVYWEHLNEAKIAAIPTLAKHRG